MESTAGKGKGGEVLVMVSRDVIKIVEVINEYKRK